VGKEVTTSLDALMKQCEGYTGFENIEEGDVIMSKAVLLQAMSPQITSGDNPGLSAGMIIDNISGEAVPEEFVPIKRCKKSYCLFNGQQGDPDFDPNYEERGLIFATEDKEHPDIKDFLIWGPNKEPPRAKEFITYLVLFKGKAVPSILSFGKTSLKKGKLFTTMTCGFCNEMGNTDPLFSHKYKLRSKKETKGRNTWYVLDVSHSGKFSAEVEGDEAFLRATLSAVSNYKDFEPRSKITEE